MTRSTKFRLDDLLVRRGLADSVSTAKSIIMAGDVIVDDQRIDKPGKLISEQSAIRLKDDGPFVSRGGDKLNAALIDLGLENLFIKKTILDVGASTGGFTDCVLAHGAKKVFALDVGTAQLAWKLRQDARVISIEKTDIRNFAPPGDTVFDWVVADVSFTSLARLVPDIKRAAPLARVLLLVKPQFELPRDMIPQGGIVTDNNDRHQALRGVREALLAAGYKVIAEVDARVAGRQGNREIFIYAEPS